MNAFHISNRRQVSSRLPAITTNIRLRNASKLILAAALVALPFYADSFTISNFTLVMVYGLAILSLDIVTGQTGQVSLGHGGLMGMGAYTAGLLMAHAGFNPYLTLIVAPVATAALGLLFATSALRLSGLYLALATFALALVVPQLARYFADVTGGSQGLVLPFVDSPVPGLSQVAWLYYLMFSIAAACLGMSRLLVRGRIGRALNAVRDSELTATVSGVNLRNYKILAFFVSSLFAGLAGACLALVTSFVSPDSFSFSLSLTLFVGLAIAGFAAVLTPLVGGLVIVYVPLLSNHIYAGKPDIVYGALIVLLVLAGRGGVTTLLTRLFSCAVPRRGRGQQSAQPPRHQTGVVSILEGVER